jgi:Mg-chelatase subunit ChlD
LDNSYTDITIILDKSGSMSGLRSDTIGGINTFIAGQQEQEGDKVLLTVIQFSYTSKVTVKRKRIENVEPFTYADYVPGGGTALLDALGDAITAAGSRFRSMREADRPSKVLFVVITDGEENQSTRYTLDRVKNMISEQQDTYKWQFVFLGANQDSFKVAGSFGIAAWNTSNYFSTSEGVMHMYTALNSNTRSYRKDSADVVQCRSFWQAPIEGVDNSTGTASPIVNGTTGTVSNP